MVIEITEQRTADVRVDRLEGRVFLTAASGEEIALDVRPSQLPGLLAAFGGDGERERAADTATVTPEELEGIKDSIMGMTRVRETFYPGKIAIELDIDYDVAVEAIRSLESEGKVREIDE